MSISENKKVAILGGCFLVRSALELILSELKLSYVASESTSELPSGASVVLVSFTTAEALSDYVDICMSGPEPVRIILFPQSEALLACVRRIPVDIAALVPPTLAAAEIKSVISLVVEGHRILPFVASEAERLPSAPLPDRIRPGLLTDRQLQILREVAKGQSNKAIARTLSISINTVEAHVSRIIRRLQVDNRTQAAIALRGEIPAPTPALRRHAGSGASFEMAELHGSARR